MFEHAYPSEIAQFLFSIFGLLLNMWGMWDAIRDTVALSGVPQSRLYVIGDLVNETSRLMMSACLFFVGLTSIVLAPPPLVPSMITGIALADPGELAQTTIIRILLMWVQLALILGTLADRMIRVSVWRETSAKLRRQSEQVAPVPAPSALSTPLPPAPTPGVESTKAEESLKNIEASSAGILKNTALTDATVQTLKEQQ